MMRIGRTCAYLCLALGFLWAAPSAHAQGSTNNGNVFLIISQTNAFDTTGDEEFPFDGTSGSQTIVVNIGTMIGGAPSPRGARFQPASITTIQLPSEFTFGDLDQNDATIFGSFQTEDLEATTPHVVTPTATDIPPDIQAAVFASSGALAAAIDPNLDGDPFLTTGEITQIVFGNLPDGSTATFQQVADAIFDTGVVLAASTTCEAEGDLFPHEPGDALFHFTFAFDEDGNFASDVCLLVDVDVQQESINIKKKGSLPVAILDSDTFDTSEVDASTVEIVGIVDGEEVSVPAEKTSLSKNKLVCHFSVPDLVAAHLLTSSTTELTIRADTTNGGCVKGSDTVKIVTK